MSAETPVVKKFTVDDYELMGEVGIIPPTERTELLDGAVYTVPPIGPAHQWCVDELTEILASRLAGLARLRVQGPAVVGLFSEPQPDLLVMRGPKDRYRDGHPTTADILLVIEVMQTSSLADRNVKVPLYAREGIPEVWLIDLQSDRVEVYRSPSVDGYADVAIVDRSGAISPQAFPDVAVRVDDIVP